MLLRDRLRVPVSQLGRRPVDSGLSLLVAACGVALVVSMAALLSGLKAMGDEALRKIGAYVVRVHRRDIGAEALQAMSRGEPRRLRVVPVSGFHCAAAAGDARAPAELIGTLPEFEALFQLEVAKGRFLVEEDGDAEQVGCVLDGALAGKLFADADPLGRSVRATFGQRQLAFTVRGVLVDYSQVDAVGLSGKVPTRNIYIHQRAVAPLADRRGVHTLLIEARDPASIAPLVSALAVQAQSLWPDGRYQVKSEEKVVVANAAFIRMMDGLGFALAVFTLLSCVLTIATLRLMALRARVGEVAIRVIEGATGSAVALQMVVECAITTGLGALAGLPLGWLLARWLSEVVGWPVVFSPPLAATALLIATVAGILAGAFPAWKAAGLDPIESLRRAREAGC